MRKRFLIVAGLLLAGVIGFLVWLNSGPREPVYEGQPLSSWLDHHVPSWAARPPYNSPGWKKADEAIRHIGTNAIPTLLEMTRARDRPAFVLKLMETAQRLGLPQKPYRQASWRHEEAEYAFQMLGTNAVSAVPELIRIYERNTTASSQGCAARALGHIGQAAQAALPALIQRFTHTNDEVRYCAVSTVMRIGGPPEVVVPALTRALKDPYGDVCWSALVGLSNFGGRARPAVPEILKMLNKWDGTSHRPQLEVSLWQIAPERVGKPLVVEDATPMIANGATTQALKVVFHGKRQTIIPAGRSVPAVSQHWSSDPRPRLTLYRGASASEETDHFLGHFEVLGLPAAENLNVSTLFVVVDGKLFLCARDNHGDIFLEIRRVETEAAE